VASTDDDLAEIEHGLQQIDVQGERLPDAVEAMTNG
jgi:hypothetical protein